MSEHVPKAVLVVEDEPVIAELISMYLRQGGYQVRCVDDGDKALATVRSEAPAAIVLDVGLPGIDGIEVCRRLRSAGDWTPVLFVTARDDEVDRVIGLELGADDYITKPFSPRELVARVNNVLRRVDGPPSAATVLVVGDVRLDLGNRRVFAGGVELELTTTEFDLLAYLMRRPGWVFTRDQLLEDVWGYDAVAGTRTVDVHVAQLRAKLGTSSPIRTVRGVGYSAETPSGPREHASR
ncbi:MAG: response regulator transcription factor [Acidimicrobiales bacterium]